MPIPTPATIPAVIDCNTGNTGFVYVWDSATGIKGISTSTNSEARYCEDDDYAGMIFAHRSDSTPDKMIKLHPDILASADDLEALENCLAAIRAAL